MSILSVEQKVLMEVLKSYIDGVKFIPNEESIKAINWEVLYEIIVEHKLFPLVYKCIRSYISDEFKFKYKTTERALYVRVKTYLSELAKISILANENNINFFIVKGFALSEILYGDIYLRSFGDIDILVRECDIRNFYYLLSKYNYRQEVGRNLETGQMVLVDDPTFKYRKDFHELQCCKMISENEYIFVELKRATSAIPLNSIEDFFINTVELGIDNLKIVTSNLLYTFLHLCANTYNDCENSAYPKGLRDTFEVGLFYRKYVSDLDWLQLRDISNKMQIAHKIYFVLQQVNDIFMDCIEAKHIEMFNLSSITYQVKCLENGGNVRWRMDFLSRQFDAAAHDADYCRFRKEDRYSRQLNAVPDIFVKNDSESILDISNYITLVINEKPVVRYALVKEQENNNFVIYFIVDDNLFDYIGRYSLLFECTDNNMESGIWDHMMTISKLGQCEDFKLKTTRIKNAELEDIKLGKAYFLRASFPFAELCMVEGSPMMHYDIRIQRLLAPEGSRGSSIEISRFPLEDSGYVSLN